MERYGRFRGIIRTNKGDQNEKTVYYRVAASGRVKKMKKYIYPLILLIGLCGMAFADTTTELPENTDPQLTDYLYWIDASAPIRQRSHKIFWGTLLDDTKGNGDAAYLWSADKIFDQFALHVAAADPHAGYMLESNIGTGANNYLKLGAVPGAPSGAKYLKDDMTWAVPGGAGTMGAWGASSEITIAVGVAALTGQGYFTFDTEGDGATDDLTQITGLADGDEIIIAPNNDARTVVVKNGANMILCIGADFTMNNTKDRMVLQHIGSNVMVEISRSSGGD